jgi:hypothetical protein
VYYKLQRLDAISEVITFMSVRRGTLNNDLFGFALSVKELGKQMSRLTPRAPRFADHDLLDDAEGKMEALYTRTKLLVARPLERVKDNFTEAFCIRAFLMTMLMSPFLGSQRAQTVARFQATATACITCGHAECRSNRIWLTDHNTIKVVVSHHKNELAGKTRVRPL